MSTQEPGMVGAALSQQMSGHTQKHTLYELTHYKKKTGLGAAGSQKDDEG